jgi:hypothetical protein
MSVVAIADDFESIRTAMQRLTDRQSPPVVQDAPLSCTDAHSNVWALDIVRRISREPMVWRGGAVYGSIEEFERSGVEATPPSADRLHAAGF